MQAVDHRSRNDRITLLRNVIVGDLNEKACAVWLDVEDAAGRNQLAARHFHRRGRAFLLHHPAAATPTPPMSRAPPPPPAAPRSLSRTLSGHREGSVAAALWIF